MTSAMRSPDHFLKPDPRYKNKLAAKFINCLMHGGKKATAERIFYDAMDEVIKKIKDKDPVEIFTVAVNNAKPMSRKMPSVLARIGLARAVLHVGWSA